MKKIAVYHFHNGSGGGVLSVIKNLLRFSTNPVIENHVIYTINKDAVKEYSCNNLEGAKSEKVFYYTPRSNFLHTCIALSKLIPDQSAVLVTHDWLELGMISNLGLKNCVITFLHGDYDYYYDLAKLHQDSIDKFVVVAENMANRLKSLLIARRQDVLYLRFPVPSVKNDRVANSLTSIAFVGRLSAEKGYNLLPVIDEILQSKNLCVSWHIAGDFARDGTREKVQWSTKSVNTFYGQITNEDVLQMLCKSDFFLLPSLYEGLPVTVVEAMKCGVVPLVNDIEGGIQELVEDGITGFKIKANNPAAFADRILELVAKKDLTERIKQNCIQKANSLFEPEQNTRLIEQELVSTFLAAQRIKIPKKIYGSRLDKKWVPNFITKTLRTIR